MKNGSYLLTVAPENYPGKKYRNRYIYQHHLIFWQAYGRCVKDGHVIHHINGNKHDNLLQNLCEMPAQDHVAHHSKKPIRHGTVTGYNRKCRCDSCKKAKNERVKLYRQTYGRKK